MGRIKIQTLSKVCLDEVRKGREDGGLPAYVDPLGLLYIPLYSLFCEELQEFRGVRLGLGRLEDYAGIASGVHTLLRYEQISVNMVTSAYIEPYRIKEPQGERVLSLLPEGLVFEGSIEAEEEDRAKIEEILGGVRTLGYTDDYVKGEVKISVTWNDRSAASKKTKRDLPESVRFRRLEYCIETFSPTCIFSPYERRVKTKKYIPGEILAEYLKNHMDGFSAEDYTIVNAYPSFGEIRGIPAPVSMSLEKLNKSVLHSRLAPEPEGYISVQTVRMDGQFVTDPMAQTIRRFSVPDVKIYPAKPESELSGEEHSMSAISEGCCFRGYIEAEDEKIRPLCQFLQANPVFSIGSCTDEGYGEVRLRIIDALEERREPEQLCREFDIFLASPFISINDKGMYEYDADALKRALEKQLGAEGELVIVRKYIESAVCQRMDSGMFCDATQMNCMQMGSSVRFRTQSDEPIDVSALSGAFIGEFTEIGYGEIRVYPVCDSYYRSCEEIEADMYRLSVPGSLRELLKNGEVITCVLEKMLRNRISILAFNDRHDSGGELQIPMELLRVMRDKYCYTVDDAELAQIYQEVLNTK